MENIGRGLCSAVGHRYRLNNINNSPIVRVAPEQIAHGSLVRHFLQTIQGSDVVQGVDRRAQAAVEAEDLAIHQRGEGQEVEQVREMLPHGRVAVLAQAFVVEPVYLGDLTGLMVTAQNCYSLAVSDLKMFFGENKSAFLHI